MARYVSIDRLMIDLKTLSDTGFPAADVREYLGSTLVEPAALEPYIHHSQERYTRNLVHKDADFEVLVLCWGSGHRAPIHGHEGELCFARVERGKLRFSNYQMLSEEPVELQLINEPIDGTVGFLDGPAEIHAVENASEFGSPATSLHIYSKPYAQCDVYDSERGPRRRVSLSYDSRYGRLSD